MSGDASLSAGVTALLQSDGRIDAPGNDVGYGSYGPVDDVPISEARHRLEVNVFGLARPSQLVLPALRRARTVTILNNSLMVGRGWTALGGWYQATRHAVAVLSDAMRVAIRPFGIRVAVMLPGRIESE